MTKGTKVPKTLHLVSVDVNGDDITLYSGTVVFQVRHLGKFKYKNIEIPIYYEPTTYKEGWIGISKHNAETIFKWKNSKQEKMIFERKAIIEKLKNNKNFKVGSNCYS